jgi:hypothetical protein
MAGEAAAGSPEATAAAAAAATAAATAAAAAAAAGAAKPWYDGHADGPFLGHLQTHGWDKMTPAEVALKASQSHYEASKFLGVDPKLLVRLPKDASDQAALQNIRSKLGVPADAKEYVFPGLKFKDGTELDEVTAIRLRGMASKSFLTKDQAATVARDVVEAMDADEAAEQAAYEAKLAVEKDTLGKNWGSNANVNKVVAENAAKTLGLTSEEISSLEKSVGYARVMEMFRNIGVRMGEDKFITNGPAGTGGQYMTKEAAEARLEQLTNSAEYQTRLNNKEPAALKEFDDLTRIVAGV